MIFREKFEAFWIRLCANILLRRCPGTISVRDNAEITGMAHKLICIARRVESGYRND